MTTKEAIYLLRNTGWLAPSLEPIDSDSCKDCELNKYKSMLLKRFGEREGE